MSMMLCVRCGKPIPDLYWEEDADHNYCHECFNDVLEERAKTARTQRQKPPERRGFCYLSSGAVTR